MSTDCTAYVSRSSTGWGVEIPGEWKGINIAYLDDEPELPDGVRVVDGVTNFWLEVEQPARGGSIGCESGWHPIDDMFMIQASANPGYRFVEWTGDVAGLYQPSAGRLAVVMDQPRTIGASFAPIEYAISYTETKGADNPNPASYTIEDAFAFSPLPNVEGWNFQGWTPSGVSAGTTGDFTATALWYRPEILVGVDGWQTTYSYGDTPTFSAPEPWETNGMQVVTLGTTFTAPAVTNEFSLTLTHDIAFFWDILATNWWLDAEAPANGAIQAFDDAGAVGTPCWMPDGAAVSFEAVPDAGFRFVRWTGDTDGCIETNGLLTATMDRARTIGAEFALNLMPVIDAISPASPTEDDAIVMQGHAEGGAAAEYLWRAAPASGGASTTLGRSQACRAKLPAGAWRIEFLARDASGAWSGAASAEVDVGESLAMPDLQVARANIVFFDALGLPTANVKTGDAVTVRATVQNRGAAALAGGAAVMLCDGIVPLDDLASLATNDARVVALGEAAPLGAWHSQTLELAWRVGLDACGNEVAYEDGPNAFTLVAIPLAGLDADASAANNLASMMLGFGDAGGTLSDLLRVSANCEPTLWEGETYAVSGAVWYERDGSTVAMAGASVALLIDGEAVGETTTDASGRYVCPFTAPAAGEHEFEVRATDGAVAKSGTGAFTSRARSDAGGEGGAGSGEDGGGEVVTPLKGPNLVVQALSFTGTNVTTIYSTASAPAGALAGVAATVANAGDVSVTNGFAVVVEISGPSDFAVLAREFNVVLALAPGESADIVWPDALAAELAGAYRARATADANGAIAESSETDNTLNAWLTVEELLPNLVVSAISLSPSRPVAGDAATATVTVGNAGNAATEEPFAVRLLRDGKPAGEAAIPAGLAAGAATNVAFAVELPSAGTVALEAVANPDGEIPESRRDDNARKLHVPVLPAEADARPVSLSASPYPEAGAACVLTATIRNEGGAAYEGGVATFYEGDPADGRAIGAGTVGAIAWKGGTGEATCVWTPAAASGDRVVTVVLDGRAYVRTFAQTAPPDLRVTAEDISWEPGTPSAGDAMRFRAMVRNVAASAAATNVTVVFTVTDEGGASTTLGAATVPRLAAGGSVAVDAGAAFVAARGVYAVSVAVGDGTGRDADASDNVASRTFGVSVPVAVAAAECTGTTGDAIALDGTASLNAASYRWTLLEAPSGSLAAIENADSAEARLVPAFAGTYRFALVVDDGETESDPAECAAVVDKVVVDVFGETPGGSIEPGGGVFPAGADVAFAPVPDAHHHFVKWIVSDADGCASTNGTLVVRMDRARAVYAKFAIDTFTVSFDPGDHGALAATNGAVQTVAFGERPAIVPAVAPDAGYKFVGWESDPSAAVSADTTFTARYSAFEYAISYEGTRGAVNSNPASYTVEDSVVFAPLPDLAGWEFAGWNPPGIAAGTTGNVGVAATWRRPALLLGEAVGAPWLEWATGGGADWAVEWGADDESAEAWVRSGSVGTNAETWIETTVQGEGTLAFSWRIACESRALHAAVEIDGVVRARLFGTNDWTDASFTLGGGEHVVRWIYRTGRSGGRSAGAAWLDSVRWTPLPPMSLTEALGATNLVWTTGGDAPWGVLRGMEAADGDGCAVSGPIGDYGSSLLSTTVGGAGTLSFWWRVSCEDGYDWFDFYMDGKLQGSLTGESGWRQVSIRIAEGTHELLWEYWKDDMDEDGLTGDDMAFLDRVAFVPDEAVPPPDETPLDEPGYALPEFQEFLRENGYVESGAGNAEINEAAAAKAANGVNTVWECYVAGIDPEDEDAKFEATITMGADGKPVVKWNPPLAEEEAAKRTYRTLGRKTLDSNEDWTDVTDLADPDAAGYRFFKVKVAMPEK